MFQVWNNVAKAAPPRAAAPFVMVLLAMLVARCASTPNVERNYVLAEAQGTGLVRGLLSGLAQSGDSPGDG